ncbi:GTPase-activating protein GYP5 [Acrodontium crateriforme]|uniref:GTPase-activating protein GYP5 n=1 Tax=Acrodontium crateriforme TaxID=150365 RepID=A0AAQ3RBZ3_9PEZI|nr:GTPase-activating protein GYP5 [Acrodontium crateriforme]
MAEVLFLTPAARRNVSAFDPGRPTTPLLSKLQTRKVSPPQPRRQPPPPPINTAVTNTPDSPRNRSVLHRNSDRKRSPKPHKNKPSRPPKKASLKGSSPVSSPPPPPSPTLEEMADKLRDVETTDDNFEDAQESTPRPSSVQDGHQDISKEDEPAQPAVQDNHTSTDGIVEKEVDTPKLSKNQSSHSRQRSASPSKLNSRNQSPVKYVGAAPLPSTPSSPEPDRVQSTESGPSVERPGSSSSANPPPLPRKASSGLAGLFGRIGRKAARSPPPKTESMERRGTLSSLRSTDSNATTTSRPTLQDQFRNLRIQEELGSDGERVSSPIGDSESARRPSDASTSRPSTPRETPVTPSLPAVNLKLPPGTASGMTAGPSEEPRPVDWDLWQQVVYEGPAAVTRSSGAELNRAIASGIPPAIRGVVWQVLADSKNEELENMYRSLKARGTNAETVSSPSASRSPSRPNTNGGEKDSVASSASSVHSETSTAAISNAASVPASTDHKSPDLQAKILAEKQNRDSVALVKLEKAIKRDLGSRTSFSKYTQSAGLQDGLFGVCKAYALFDEGVGYAQGINFITMPLLFNMSEEEAFTLLVRLMGKYDLRSLFTAEMTGLHLRLYQFERLLEDLEPALYCHLKRRNVSPQLYATQWFLTLFAYRFPLQLVLRVYDLILTDGLSAILKFGIVLMQRNRDALLQMKDMAQLTTFLKEKIFDVYIDKAPSASSLLDSGFFGSVTGGADKELYRADELVRDATEVALPDTLLAMYTAEWEETQAIERERAEQLETLRSTNISLASRVKNLEDRTQQQDTEHVSIASDLIKLKLSNEFLADENEVLKTKVEELQRMVDLQPGEVEDRLKGEMERIMQRNIEVQNENRALKEEMDEVESELVKVKMMHAQSQSDHDALRQKWSSVQAMLNNTT